MDIANPMPQAFEKPELVAHIEAEGKIARVIHKMAEMTQRSATGQG
jgi:hypothetical protein